VEVTVCDVGPRDGLQNEHATLAPPVRAELVDRLAAAGLRATEDLVYLLHGEGVDTGVDLDALIGVSAWLEGVLGRELPGQVYRAGGFAPVAG
jgi:isopropylmalate/homocitrate/citramalate synthase